MRLTFVDESWEDYLYWQRNDDEILIAKCRFHYD